MGKHIEIRLALPVVGPLVDFILPLIDEGSGELAAPPDLGKVDDDMRDFWHEDLVASHRADVEFFRDLFGDEFHTSGMIEFPEEACESVVRACSSVRLKLRTTVLEGVPDESLEGGDIDYEALDEDQKTGFMAYAFIASFQEILIRHMDPGIAEG